MTTSAQVNLDRLFDEVMKILSEIPSDRAMKELSKNPAYLPATRQAIETIALRKEELVKSLRLMRIREKALLHENSIARENLSHVDKMIAEYLRDNPEFEL